MEHFLWVDNQRSAQSKFVVDHFLKILSEFSLIIELGTFTGVFTKWLSENISESCKIITYDINPNYREVGELKNTIFKVADILDPATIFEIKSLIEFSGKVLFLCDGGDKETEFKLYSKFLKHGDVIMLHDYEHNEEEYEIIKKNIGWTTVSESHYKNLDRYLSDLQLEQFMYEKFKQVLWGSFIKKKYSEVTLSITTSNRIDLFNQTIHSFSEKCLDIDVITKVFHFDDSSNNDDRNEMETVLKKIFPKAQIITYQFNESSFLTKKRHCQIMNVWLKKITLQSDYNFHLEDDWFFTEKFKIKDLIDFISKKDDVAYVGVSQFLRNFPKNIIPTIEGNFWKWHFDPTQKVLSNLFLDTKTMELENVEGFWCYYINWPYFGFRPGLWDVQKLSFLSDLRCDDESHFELSFALDLSKKFISYSLTNSVCYHIGNHKSSYEINNSER